MAPSAPKASSRLASSSTSAWRGAKATTTQVPRYSASESAKRFCPRTKASAAIVGAAVPVTYSMCTTIGARISRVVVAADDLAVVLPDDGSLVWSHGRRPPQDEDRRHHRARLLDARSGPRARRRRRRRDQAQSLSREPPEPRGAGAGRARGSGREWQAAGADRRPPGAEAPDRRPARPAHAPEGRGGDRRRRADGLRRRAAGGARGDRRGPPSRPRRADRRRTRPALGSGGAARTCPLPRGRRRRGEVAQGRQPARGAGADPLADAQGS